MCGIAGKFLKSGTIADADILHALKFLSHRGPDGYGLYKREDKFLLHTRLSIIDLQGGAQPLRCFQKRFIGIVNGELYDYQQIRERLLTEGVSFETKSDSEVLLNYFSRYGIEALQNLSGEFAFIFYDQLLKEVHFGRDSFGVKPLFMTFKNNELSLASEMKAISKESPEFDEVYIKRFLGRMIVPPRTCLKDVDHVMPGYVYTLKLDSFEISRKPYAQNKAPLERNLKGEEARELIESELKAAVSRRMIADVKVGCYLSGGLDSSLIAAMMVELGGKPKTFTVGFSDKDYDETEKAKLVANHLGLENEVVKLTSKNFLTYLKRSILAFENPIANPHGAAKCLLSELAGQQVKVVLSGEGADELFGGYAYLRQKKLNRYLLRMPKSGSQLSEKFFARDHGSSNNHLVGTTHSFDDMAPEYFNGQIPAIYQRLPSSLVLSFLTGENSRKFVRYSMQALQQLLRADGSHKAFEEELDLDLLISQKTDLLHYILSNVGDRQEMHHSIEGRTPFLDLKVARAAERLAPGELIFGLEEKSILKKLALSRLPASLQIEKKHAFFSPYHYLYQKNIYSEMDAYIEKSREFTGWLPWKSYDHFFSRRGRTDHGSLSYLMTTLRLALFSIGLLGEELRKTPAAPRGYDHPTDITQMKSSIRFSED